MALVRIIIEPCIQSGLRHGKVPNASSSGTVVVNFTSDPCGCSGRETTGHRPVEASVFSPHRASSAVDNEECSITTTTLGTTGAPTIASSVPPSPILHCASTSHFNSILTPTQVAEKK